MSSTTGAMSRLRTESPETHPPPYTPQIETNNDDLYDETPPNSPRMTRSRSRAIAEDRRNSLNQNASSSVRSIVLPPPRFPIDKGLKLTLLPAHILEKITFLLPVLDLRAFQESSDRFSYRVLYNRLIIEDENMSRIARILETKYVLAALLSARMHTNTPVTSPPLISSNLKMRT